MKTRLLLIPLLLAGCGKAAVIHPPEGAALPVAPYGAKARPNAVALTTPPTQSRPTRSDELLRSSQDRRDDEFDLPPK